MSIKSIERALNQIYHSIHNIRLTLNTLFNSIYNTGFTVRNENAEIVIGTDSLHLKSDSVVLSKNGKTTSIGIDGNSSSSNAILNNNSLYYDNIDTLRTIANLLIPSTAQILLNYNNNPINPDQTLLDKENEYWYIIYQLSETNIPVQADSHATYFGNYFTTNTSEYADYDITIEGYYPYCAYFSITIYSSEGNVIGSLIDQNINPKPGTGSTNPFLPGNYVYTDIQYRQFSIVISNHNNGADIVISKVYNNVSVVFRFYENYLYNPYGVPSNSYLPTWTYQVKGIVQPTTTNKQPAPVIGHLVTRPIPNSTYPNSWYRLSSIEVPYGDGDPQSLESPNPPTNYLAHFIFIGRETSKLTITLPTTFNTNTINTQSYNVTTYPTDLDVAYMSWSVYAYSPLTKYTISSNDLLAIYPQKTTFDIILINDEQFKELSLDSHNYDSVLKQFYLPVISEQQNIIIQRSKKIISQNFQYSVLNVPSSYLTIVGSFQDPKYIANSDELGSYLPQISSLPIPNPSTV